MVNSSDAAAELLRRRRAKDSLLDYAKYIDIPGKPVGDDDDSWVFEPVETGLAQHHLLMLDVFERVIRGELPRAMIFCPPGSAKSTYGSVVAPTWAMGINPETKIILTSYGSELAKKHGRKARQVVKSKRYENVFGSTISKETSAADFWSTTNGSEYMSGGVLSGITGNRAHGLIIDDPVKGRQEADSETTQKRSWEAYNDDLKTRLFPGGWEIIIQTRWSENDLSGKLLPGDYDGETGLIRCRDDRDWYVLCLPAQHQDGYPPDPLGREPGEYIWQEWFTQEHFEGFKKIKRTWSALFQQRPSADSGDFFERDWFRRYRRGEEPENLHRYKTSDHAPGGQEGNDRNCYRIWGIDSVGDLWMLDGFNKVGTMDVVTDMGLDLVRKHRPFSWFPENDNNWKSISGFVTRRMQERGVFCRVNPISPHGQDKPTKALPAQSMAAMGRVWIPEGEEGDAIIDQYVKFPAGAHDDEVDNLSLICRAIDQAHPAIIQRKVEQPKTQAEADWAVVTGKSKEGRLRRYA